MLKRVTDAGGTCTVSPGEPADGIRIADASFPSPFPRTLEYNAPAHGTWNIVHIGMAVPQSPSIYVCSDNCLRGVVMTAAEMGCRDRFSGVLLQERDVQIDNLETITIEGVSDVIANLAVKPPVMFVFLVCLHIFTGSDEDYIFRELSRRWPKIRFVKGYMDCIRQKEGPTPDMKLRMAEYGIIEPLTAVQYRVNVLGGDVRFDEDCELIELLTSRGYDVRQLQDCRTFREFLALGDASVNICTYPNARDAIEDLSGRMDCSSVYLSAAMDYEEIRAQILALQTACGFAPISGEWFDRQEEACEQALGQLAKCLEGCSVAIDYTAHSRPLGIARLLIAHGIEVACVFLDQVLDEEREAFAWLQDNSPDLALIPTIQPRMVLYGRGRDACDTGTKMVAVGQKAAWFCQTGYFVNMIEGGGLWGYQGIRRLCRMMEEASEKELDYRQIIPRKGMGWPSVCGVPS